MKKNINNYLRQIELSNRGERKLRQDMPRPSAIPDKKKEADKKSCRSKEGRL